jgi:hypothetical protein
MSELLGAFGRQTRGATDLDRLGNGDHLSNLQKEGQYA